MTWWMVLTSGSLFLFVLLFLGVPIFVSFLILNVVGVLVLIGPAGFGMFANSIYATATNSELAAVPLFILMGELLFRSGAMEVLLDSLDRLVGKIRGRQYVLCVVLSAIIGALSGAAMAVAGLLGRSLYPTMRRRGYDVHLSTGSILGGASLDPIIPPSVLAIIIASLAKVSTGQLLIAGFAPGILLTVIFLAYILIRVRLNPKLAPEVDSELRDPATRISVVKALLRIMPVSLIFFMVIGLIILGVATPTEAAATGVFGAVLLAVYYGGLNTRMLTESISSGITVAGLLLAVMSCATMFSQLLTFSGAIRVLGEFIIQLDLPGPVMLFILLFVPFMLFMVLDQVSVLMVLIPIYLPILGIYQFDPIWFWTLMLITATVGGITPPFGYTLYAFKSAAPDISASDLFKSAWPFVWLILLGMLVMAIFPQIITFLPNSMR